MKKKKTLRTSRGEWGKKEAGEEGRGGKGMKFRALDVPTSYYSCIE